MKICQNGVYLLWIWDWNEFRLDLLEYIKTHEDLDKNRLYVYAVVNKSEDFAKWSNFCIKKSQIII